LFGGGGSLPNNICDVIVDRALVMGDALALALLKARNFSLEELAAFIRPDLWAASAQTCVRSAPHGDAIPLVTVGDGHVQMIWR